MAVGTPAAVSRDITWQDLESMNFGVDFRFFDSSLGFTFGLVSARHKNMIVPGEGVALTFGANAPKGNYGSMRTDGWEIALDYNHRFENGIGINVMGTLSDAVTTVLKYGDTQSIDGWYKGKNMVKFGVTEPDRFISKEDFVLDADGNPQKITLTENEKQNMRESSYKLSDAKGSPYIRCFCKIVLISSLVQAM